MSPSRLSFVGLALVLLGGGSAHAANYKHPYANVDPRNDAGNDTGDAVTDQLNSAQLQRPGVTTIPAYPAYPGYYARIAPPARYYTPPPGYVVAPAYPAYGYGW